MERIMRIEHREWVRLSSNGVSEVYSQMYTCEEPKAIIQIAHGMSERSERYRTFMQYLANQGYMVCANDHLGHGKSSNGEFGVFAKEAGGFEYIIEDMHRLFEEVKQIYPDVPFVLVGQSMGSILSALFADRYNYLSKLILMGTPAYNNFVEYMERGLRKSVEKHGYTHTSKVWNRIIWGKEPIAREKKIKHYSWLTTERQFVEEFVDDELCGHMFVDSANLEMMSGLIKWGNRNWGRNIPNIPILFLVGTKDKIANYGKGTAYYYDLLQKTHTHLKLQMVEGNRHEVLNEYNRENTYQYILEWLESVKN